MAKDITKFFIKNQKAVLIGAFILLGLYLLKPAMTLSVTTASLFGLFGFTFSLSVLVFLVGAFLIVIPTPVTTMTGIVMCAISILTGGLSFIAAIDSLIKGIPLGTIGLVALGAFAVWTIYKYKLRRYR